VAEGHMLRLIDARTGKPILTRQESAQQQKQRADLAEQQKEQEKQRADALAAELARLRTEPGKRRGKNP